jgi:hypothetical protein
MSPWDPREDRTNCRTLGRIFIICRDGIGSKSHTSRDIRMKSAELQLFGSGGRAIYTPTIHEQSESFETLMLVRLANCPSKAIGMNPDVHL